MLHRMTNAVLACTGLVALSLSTGCGGEFDETKIHNAAEHTPFHLDSEQATLNQQQLDCGVDKDLWEQPVQVSDRSIARLNQSARDLGFNDDVSVGDTGYINPYVQVRGDFMVRVTGINDTKDGPGQEFKTVTGGMAVHINHPCFNEDLPLMGVRKGQFNPSYPITMIFAFDNNDWRLDHLTH